MRMECMTEGRYTEEQVLNLVRRAYNEGKANFDVVPEKCALLVIDMQDEFVKPHWTPDWVPEATNQVPRIKRLMHACQHNLFSKFTFPYLNFSYKQFFRFFYKTFAPRLFGLRARACMHDVTFKYTIVQDFYNRGA